MKKCHVLFSPHVSNQKVGGILQPIDKRLVVKIGELVGEGVKTVEEMKRHLRQFVKTELFPGENPPASTNRRYYPTDVDVRNHMYQASVKKMLSKTDQEHKTMRYELPLFFLVVKTNVNYIVVGSFIIQRETTASIQEALGIFHDWNGSWKPQYFMTDFCHEEIHAIERTFPGKNDSKWVQCTQIHNL